MVDVNVDFVLEPDVTYTADIKAETGTKDHSRLSNRDIPNQHPMEAITGLENALDSKVEKTDTVSQVYGTDSEGNQTTYDLSALGSVNDVQVDGISIVEDHIANLGTMALESLNDYSTTAVADTLYASISYEGTIDNHIADKNNPHEVTKSQVGLGNVDNTSDLNKPISTATQTALDGKQASLTQTQLDAVNSGANTTNIGQITTNANDISALQSGKADKATTLAGYGITDAYTKTTADSTFVPQTRTVNGKALSSNISLTYSDVGADASGSASTAETNAKNYADSLASNYATAAQGAKADTAVQPGDLATVATSGDYDDLLNKPTIPVVNNATLTIQKNGTNVQTFTANASTNVTANITVPTKVSDLTNDSNFQTATQVSNSIATETTNRENADISLQNQIDAIVSSSDVFDIVGTYAELQAYDISTVPVNDIIKVLVDSTHSNAATYYRCVESGGVKSWSYIGSEGAYYTKSETDTLLQAKQDEITSSNKLSADLVDDTNSTNKFVTASEKSAISTALQPADLTGYATETWVGNQGYITGINSSDVTTALGYTPLQSSDISNMVTTDTAQNITGTKTFVGQKKIGFKQSSSSDKLGFTLYDNNNVEKGYLEFNPSNLVDNAPLMTLGNYASASAGITHVGFRKYSSISGENGAYNLLAPLVKDAKTPFSLTTTYTNFYLPLGFTDGADTVTTSKSGVVDFSTLLTKKQDTLVSGTNIKTINNSSILGSGNIDIDSLPSQTGQSGKFLTTNGTTASWGTPAGATYTAGTGIDITSNVISVDGISTSEITLATVATSGSYNDLSNKPTIPAAQVNSDWNANSGVAQILNKPNILTSVDSSSTNNDTVGAKFFYDTCGDIETLINAL